MVVIMCMLAPGTAAGQAFSLVARLGVIARFRTRHKSRRFSGDWLHHRGDAGGGASTPVGETPCHRAGPSRAGGSDAAGKPFALAADGLPFIPQAQPGYVSTRFDDKFGAEGDSLQGRIGIARDYQHDWLDAGAGRTQPASMECSTSSARSGTAHGFRPLT